MNKNSFQKEIQNIVNQIIKKYNSRMISFLALLLFGKRKENSDIDLLVIKETKKDLVGD